MSRNKQILLVDDEAAMLAATRMALEASGYNDVLLCQDSRNAIDIIEQYPISVVVLDLIMPRVSGETILESLSRNHPALPVIVLTAVDAVESAVDAMKRGAADYLVKPVDRDRLVAAVSRALEITELRDETQRLKQLLMRPEREAVEEISGIIFQSSRVGSLIEYVRAIATGSQPVLITGETGVGKELFSRLVHDASGRRGEYVVVNVAGTDATVFADSLFGHVKGAYTGAVGSRAGVVEKAKDGTLVLDEIGDLDMQSQVKLLRLLQEREYYPLGGDVPKRCSARIVASTNRDLEERTKRGAFRRDLLFRLSVHNVVIPPLRSRREDIVPLTEHFVEKAATEFEKADVPELPSSLLQHLQSYDFPGNVRELEAMLYDAVGRFTGGELEFPGLDIGGGPDGNAPFDVRTGDMRVYLSDAPEVPTLREMDELLLAEALKRSRGNQTIAALTLGISRQALNKRLSRKRRSP